MLISLTWQRALVFDVIAWVLIGVGSGYWQAKRPLAALRNMGPFTRMGAREYGAGYTSGKTSFPTLERGSAA